MNNQSETSQQVSTPKMKSVRVSSASRSAARGGKEKLVGLSLGELQDQREQLIAEKYKLSNELTENKQRKSREVRRMRKRTSGSAREREIALQDLIDEIESERTSTLAKSRKIDGELASMKHQIRQITGQSSIPKNADSGVYKLLSDNQMEQFGEGLRKVLRDEFKLNRKNQSYTSQTLHLLKRSSALLQALIERCDSEVFQTGDLELIQNMINHLENK